MKVKWDKMRSLLEAIESKPMNESWIKTDKLSKEEIYYYTELIEDDGLVIVEDRILIGYEIAIKRLTVDGHRVLEGMRNETIWNKIASHTGLMPKDISSLAIKMLLAVGLK